jgi:hypothetical protein
MGNNQDKKKIQSERFRVEALLQIQYLKCINPECKRHSIPAKDMIAFKDINKGTVITFKEEKVCCEVFEVIIKQAIKNLLPKA